MRYAAHRVLAIVWPTPQQAAFAVTVQCTSDLGEKELQCNLDTVGNDNLSMISALRPSAEADSVGHVGHDGTVDVQPAGSVTRETASGTTTVADVSSSQVVSSDQPREARRLRFAARPAPEQPLSLSEHSRSESGSSEAASPGATSSEGTSHPDGPDADEPDPRILRFEQLCRRLGMPGVGIKSWRDTVSMPWLLAPFHTVLAPATMVLVVVTYIGGTNHLTLGRRISLRIVTAVNVIAHAASFTGVWMRGPQYIAEFPKLAGSQLLLHVITSSYLEWSLLLATEATLPYQNRFAFLALLTAEHWFGFASAISGGVPWDKHLRSKSLWPIFWNASLRTAKGGIDTLQPRVLPPAV